MTGIFPEFSNRPEVQALQVAQSEAADAYYEALNDVSAELYKAEPLMDAFKRASRVQMHERVSNALNAYRKTVDQLIELLGKDAHCNYVDSILYTEYMDLHKSREGFRNRGHLTREACGAYLQQDIPF